jgi:hypothetical protein
MFGFCNMSTGLQKVPANDMRNGKTLRQFKTETIRYI